MFASAKAVSTATASGTNECVDHIPLITFLDCRVHIFSDNLSRNSCRIRPVLDDLFRANSLNVIK